MKVTSSGIVNGVIMDQYGCRGVMNEYEMPTFSLPLMIEEAPQGTVSYALVLEDKDAFPVSGFSWIHWTAANITRTVIKENESQTATDFVQGVNSWISDQEEIHRNRHVPTMEEWPHRMRRIFMNFMSMP